MACLLGHKWNGCKCEKCGKNRDEGHQWKRIEELGFEVCSICRAQRPIRAAQPVVDTETVRDNEKPVSPECRRLTETLRSAPDYNVRRDAAKALAGFPEREGVDALIYAMKHDCEWPVRFNCAEALGEIGDARAVGPLTEALLDNSNTVIKYAAVALGKIGDPQAIEPMLGVMRRYQNGDYTGVDGVIQGFGLMGETVVPRLIELAGSGIHYHVIRALAMTASPSALELLIKEASDLQQTAYHRSLIVDGIGRVGGIPAMDALLELLDTAKDEAVVKAVVKNLEALGIRGENIEERKKAAQIASAQKLLDGLCAIRPGMTEEEADRLVGGANFGMGANQVHQTRFGSFQLLVNNGIVYDTLYFDVVIKKIEEYLGTES